MGPRAFARIMLMLLVMGVGMSDSSSAYEWVVDPLVPGAELPSAGASLFDRLTTGSDGRQHIPYPYEALIDHIESIGGCTASPCTRSVLIPLGRSLQRMAASPDFFAHPRVVTAAVAEGGGVLLRDRLYLGFQRRAGVIEVISYNDVLGRFEFQIVKNYAPGRRPQAIYARRTMCLSCHQNQGPIFSRQVWLETNANSTIADRLQLIASSFSGVAARSNIDVAQSIDDATDRANRFALTQRLWLDGCGRGERGDRCRRGALGASLQLALTGGRSYAHSAPGYRDNVVRVLARNALERWPDGIAIPDPDIANRDPLARADAIGPALAAVEVRFDPLVPRAPLEVLSPSDGDRLSGELVNGLAAFWSQRDLQTLAASLRHEAPPRLTLHAPCRVWGAPGREQFECAGATGFRLGGALSGDSGSIDQVGSDGSLVRHLPVQVQRLASTLTLHLRQWQAARLADGDVIEQIVLRTDAPAATIEVRRDYALLEVLIERIQVERAVVGSEMLGELLEMLSGNETSRAEPRAVAVADPYTAVPASADSLVRALESQCGSCHHTQEPVPPNFLSGDAKRVTAAIESCARRIYVRLAMRDLPVDQRDRSPMPPDILAGGSVRHGGDDRAVIELRAALEAHLQRLDGERPSIDRLLERGYEALPPCLPAALTETLQ